MTADEYEKLKNWFYTYTSLFIAEAEDPAPYLLKQNHTERVCDNIDNLSNSMELGQNEKGLARATALLHDIGRFSQFQIYGTFSDPLSKNHAALGVRIITKNGLLVNLSDIDRCLIIRAVALHNQAVIPQTVAPDLLKLIRMLRDSDKIDIYKVMADLYQTSINNRQSYIIHSHPDDKKLPVDLVKQIISGRRINYNQVNTLNGMKLFQLSMIFDLNFPASFAVVKEKDILRIFLKSMPESSDLDTMALFITRYINEKINQ